MCKRRRYREDVDAGELQWLEDIVNELGRVFVKNVTLLLVAILTLPYRAYRALRDR